jgi:hypothetical protein
MPSTLNGACLDYARAVLVVVCVWSVILSDRDDGERKTRKRSIKAISSPVRLGRE